MSRRLSLTFKNADGKAFNLSIANPKSDLNSDTVIAAAKNICEKKVLVDKDGEVAEALSKAKIIETTITPLV